MKRYIYSRVSGDGQDYQQQAECIRQYFERQGIDPASITETVVETVSGTVSYGERKLSDLIDRCEPGDVIYISELSRLSRSMSDLFALVNKCCDKGKTAHKGAKSGADGQAGVTIIQCKDGTVIENDSIAGKAILFALGLAAEIEVRCIRQRTKMALAARMEEAKRNGFWISKTGNVCTRIGNAPGYDNTAMCEAAAVAMGARKAEWQESSLAYKFAKRKFLEGWTSSQISAELNAMDADSPGMYRTREGAPVTPACVRDWKMSMGFPLPERVIKARETKRLNELWRKRRETLRKREATRAARAAARVNAETA